MCVTFRCRNTRRKRFLVTSICQKLWLSRQRDVLEQGKRTNQELRWQVSFCRDGSSPEKR